MPFSLTLAVRDLDRSEHFYRDLLRQPVERFRPLPDAPPVLLVRCGDAVLVLRSDAALATRHPVLFHNLDRLARGIGMALEFTVPAIEPLCRSLEHHGIRILYELDDEEFRRRELWVHDPDGYLVVLNAETPGDLKAITA